MAIKVALMPGELPDTVKMGRERFGMDEDGDELDEAHGRLSALRKRRDRGYAVTRQDVEHCMETLHLARNKCLAAETADEKWDSKSHGRATDEADRRECGDARPNKGGIEGDDDGEPYSGVHSAKLNAVERMICDSLGVSHRDFAISRGRR